VTLAAIDPGLTQSAVVVVDVDGPAIWIRYHAIANNADVLAWLRLRDERTPLVIEKIEGMGMAVGADVFETVYWSGRFAEAWPGAVSRVTRRAVKLHLCGSSRAKDPNVRQALIDRFGPGRAAAIGTSKHRGPLYEISADEWAALAVAVTAIDTVPALALQTGE
jgi:hypothetical protein